MFSIPGYFGFMLSLIIHHMTVAFSCCSMPVWSSYQITLQRDVTSFHHHSLKNSSIFQCFLWAETLKHLALGGSLAINLCLIILSDSLYLKCSEKTNTECPCQSSFFFFSKYILFVFNPTSDIHIRLKGGHSPLRCFCWRLLGWGENRMNL